MIKPMLLIILTTLPPVLLPVFAQTPRTLSVMSYNIHHGESVAGGSS